MTVHKSPITVNGWKGSGYAILDSEYGVGAYKISGGDSGAFATVAGLSLMAISALSYILFFSIVGAVIFGTMMGLSIALVRDGVRAVVDAGMQEEDVAYILKYVSVLSGILAGLLKTAQHNTIRAFLVYVISIFALTVNTNS